MRNYLTSLIEELSCKMEPYIAHQIVDSYIEMIEKYHLELWDSSELNGGKFCEAIARAFYFLDGEEYTDELPNKVADMLLDKSKQHKYDIKDRDHFCRVLRVVYKFRNDRGVAHISNIHTANHLDATLVIAEVKWLLADFLSLVLKREINAMSELIEQIIVPEDTLVHELEDKPLIMSVDLTAREEILILLNRSLGKMLERNSLKEYIPRTSSAIDMAIYRACQARELRINAEGLIAITTIGTKKVRDEILPRLNGSTRTDLSKGRVSSKSSDKSSKATRVGKRKSK